MPRRRSVVAKIPKKKISDRNEQVQLMKTLKGRLIEISLKVDNYIYKQKPITKLQAKAFLNEVTSYKSHCQNDIGYLQVIDKLTKYMNIIISNNTTKTPVNDINSNVKVIEAPNKSTLSSTNENLQTPTDVAPESTNQDKTQNSTKNQNNLGLALHNASTSGTEATSKDKYENDKQCYKKIEKRNIIKKTVDLDKGGVTNIFSKVLENGDRVESNDKTNLSQTANTVQGGAVYKDDKKATTNKEQTLQIENKVQNSLKNDYRFLICVDGGVIHDIKHLSNATVVHEAPEVHIPLNDFVINNTKTPNTSSDTQSTAIQIINSGKVEKNDPIIIDKPRGEKANNKKVKFTAPYIDLTENARPSDNKSDDKNNKKKFTNTLISNNSGISIFLKERSTENDVTKNKNGNKRKESRLINDKKTKPAIKRKANKSNNISNDQDIGIKDKKSQPLATKRKINKHENIIKSNLPKLVKPSSNDLNAQSELSWFDSIKYVRKVDEQEYFKPLQPLDATFWCNPGSILSDDRDFTIL